MKTYISLIAVLLAAACGNGNRDGNPNDTTDGGGGVGDGGGTVDAPPYNEQTFTVEFGPVDVDPGVEDTQCVIVELGNEAAINVKRIHNELETTSHHMIVYRTNEAVQAEPFPCQPFTDTLDPTKGNLVMISQKADDTLELPDGVALEMAAGQRIRLEMHFINATLSPAVAHATSTFTTMPPEEVVHTADLAFIGNPDINIPPMSTASLSAYLPMPAEFAGKKFYAITGHTHQYGTAVTIDTASGPNPGDIVDNVYAPVPYLWEEPETTLYDPGFEIPDGGGFQFTCSWQNTSNQSVGFGEDFNDEMCFFWAYYYPSVGSKVCIHTDQQNGIDICCPGNDVICPLILDYLDSL